MRCLQMWKLQTPQQESPINVLIMASSIKYMCKICQKIFFTSCVPGVRNVIFSKNSESLLNVDLYVQIEWRHIGTGWKYFRCVYLGECPISVPHENIRKVRCICDIFMGYRNGALTYSFPMHPFSTPWKHPKTDVFME